MPEEKTKRICKVCPKKKPCKKKEVLIAEEETELFELAVEEETVEEEEEDFPCLEEESCKEVVTGGFVLDEIPPEEKRKKSLFYCARAPVSRYENMIPVDLVNDHQYQASIQKTVIDHMSCLRVNSEPFCKRQTAVIATLGPSCWEVDQIEELLDAGMNIARINMAYGDRCCQVNAIHNFKTAVKNFSAKVGFRIPVGLLMDLKGPDIRTGRICRMYACDPANPKILIEKNSVVKLTTEVTFADKCTPNLIFVDFPDFTKYIRPGMKIYLNNGTILLIAQNVKESEVITRVLTENYLGNYRPIHVPMVSFVTPTITNIDAEDIELAIEEDFDFIALSKIKSPTFIEDLRGKLMEITLTAKKLREQPIKILAKISNYRALSEIDNIIQLVDGIIIHRGDLLLDLPPEKLYVAQKEVIAKCNLSNKPVICSTYLMPFSPDLITANASYIFDLGNAIDDGTDAISLASETAIGPFPAQIVELSHHVIREAEAADTKKYFFKELMEKLKPPIEPVVAIGMAACIVAEKIKASVIIVLTTSGRSAQIISWFRPRCIVLAVTKFEKTARQLNLWKSICPLFYSGPCIKNNWFANLDLRFQYGITFGKEVGFIRAGDPLILVSGYGKSTTFTNCLRIVYASTEPGIFLEHSKEFYDNTYLQRDCPRSSCHGGFLQLVDGSSPVSDHTEIKICGNNDRYDPPVLVFADNGPATLIFQLFEDTFVSQFIAYYSFTSVSSKQGIYYKGGKKIENTDCDWLYQDFECRSQDSCILTSPGYPGLYAPNKQCKYLIAISSMQTRVKISFASLLLPQNRCKTDNIAIYQGTSPSSLLLKTICGRRKQELIFHGPNLLLEFSSGPPVPPYNYNGFRASLEFFEKLPTTQSSINFMLQTTESNLLMDSTSSPKSAVLKSGCDIIFYGNVTRSGTFDTRGLKWSSTCLFTFIGRFTDVVHVSLFNYYLRATSCQNSIEIYDGLYEHGIKPLRKICSPVTKHARDSSTGRFVEQQSFVSSDSTFSIFLRRSHSSFSKGEAEFLDGAYLFHDEQVDGTLRPSTLCDVDYYGLSSASQGQVKNPGTQDLFFNIDRPLHCIQRFIPAANQSITLNINHYRVAHVNPYCHTQCGDGGCFCVLNSRTLAQVDHLLLQTENGQTLSCLCGEFQEDWLPVTLKSWSAVKLVYFVAQFSWETKGFNFTTNYSFITDGICGHYTLTNLDGEIESIRIVPDGQLNFYYHQRCTWLLDTKIERQLTIELYTPQNRNCGAWNLTIHHYDETSLDRAGVLIETFCPRQRHKKYELPWKTDLVVVRLQATTHTPPEFTLRWRSQVFRSNNRLSDPSPPPSSASRSGINLRCWFPAIAYFIVRLFNS